MTSPLQRVVASLLSTTLVLGSVPAWAAREVSCDSHSMRRVFCPTGEHGSVRLAESRGFWPCDEGRTWGTERDGIWVTNDCKGRFWVEEPSHDSNHDNRNAAIAAGVLGAILVGALVASNSKRSEGDSARETDENAPNWLIGRYHGYDPDARRELTLEVSPTGRVSADDRGRRLHGRVTGGNAFAFDDGSRFQVERTNRGFRSVSERDRDRVVEYYRDR